MKPSIPSLYFLSLWIAAVAAAPQGKPTCTESAAGSAPTAPNPPADASDSSTAHKSGGEEYVVIFDSSKPEPAHVTEILNRLELSPEHADVHYTFGNSAFRGFAASMKSHCIDLLHNMTEVAAVEKSVQISTVSRDAAPWGLERISSSGSVRGDPTDMDFTYSAPEDDQNLGAGVDIYVVDTGVNVEHSVFGGRARMGFSFEQDASDGDGHGTHVAGTAAGSVFGVAPGANVIGVKVLGANGAGFTSDTIAGMDFIIRNHDERKSQPGFVGSIMSMSWGLNSGESASIPSPLLPNTNFDRPVSDSIAQAIQAAVDSGIHVSVAAGNAGEDSCAFSPASSGGSNGPAVTVGSIGIDDTISSFSNTGACNDIYAPGEDILSAWIDSPKTINVLSGTSMACPHVTGVMATLMVDDPRLAGDPAAMKKFLRETSLRDVVRGRPASGDPMLLLNNGVDAGAQAVQVADATEGDAATDGGSSGDSDTVVVSTVTSDKSDGFLGRTKILSALFGSSATVSTKQAVKWDRISNTATIRY